MPAHAVLVEAGPLAQELAGGYRSVVLDVRWSLGGPAAIDLYRDSHVPGARFCDLDRDLAAPPRGHGRHPIPSAADFTSAMRRLGIGPDDRVVVYDAANSSVAARAWWCLRYFGHQQVRVLNGGFRAWLTSGGDVESGEPSPVRPGEFTAHPGGMPVLEAPEAAALARSGLLIDARAPARYRGETEPVDPVAGHIPGAVNAPTSTFVDVDGRLLEPAALTRWFAELTEQAVPDRAPNPPGAVPVGAYCGSGVNAAQPVLAGALAGREVSLYVGSWSEWVSDLARPVQLGAEPG
jgi:thiosulfate/3-mercaptopyruvate sulfurtransferase